MNILFFSHQYEYFNTYNNLDASGNPVTETVQSVVLTDSSGNPVTGNQYKLFSYANYFLLPRNEKSGKMF